MRHRKAGVKLNRNSSHRKAMFRNMVTSLFKYEKIRTTDTKAKALRSLADHLVTLAKRGDLHARRQALSIIREKDVVHKLFEEAAEKFGNINGGYTRLVKLGRRPGDAAPVSLVELIYQEGAPKKKTAPKKAEPKSEPVVETPVKEEASAAEEPSKEAVDAAPSEEEQAADAEAAPEDATDEEPVADEAAAPASETEPKEEKKENE